MGVNGPNLQDLFNQRFGAGSYEAGVNNAYNAGRAIYTAKQQAIQQQLFEQYQKQMEAQQKAAAAAQAKQQAAQDKLNKPLLDQQKAYNFWLGPDGKAGADLLQKGAYRSVKDIQDDPMIQAKLKSEGYDLQSLYDQAYNVASGKATNPGSTQKFASAKAFSGFEKDLSDSTKDERKQNLANWDPSVAMHQAQVQAQQDARNAPSFFDRAKALGGEALDFLGRPLNAVETGISDTLNGGNFLQGAKEGLLGQRHTSGTQLLSQIGLDPNKNDTSKVLSRLLGNAVISKLPLGSQVAPWLSNTLKQNIGQQTAGYGVDTALDPLNALIGAGEVSNLAKGSKLLEATNSLKYDPAAFEQALKDSFSPKGNVSNVLADAPKEMPKPFEQKYNIPQLTPQVKPQVNADVLKQSDWFGFGQQGNTPQGRGMLQDVSVPKAQSGAIRSLANDTLNKANTFTNAPSEGFNQRLLNVQQDMKGLQNNAQSIANQHGGTYKPDVESLYQQVKQPNDPKTFDELVKMAQMEHGANNPSLTSMLQQDPKVKAGIDALNSLGKGATKKAETVKQSNVLKGLNIPEVKGPKQQIAHELLKAAQVDRSIKPGGNGSLLMPLKPTVLESVKVNKSLHTMSKGELQDIMSKLEKQESLAVGDETKLKAIESDKKKVSDLMMKLDLQQFGANAEKLNPLKAVQEKLKGKAPEKTPQDVAREHAQINSAVKKLEEKGAPVGKDEVKAYRETKDILPWQKYTKTIPEIADKLPTGPRERIINAFDKGKEAHINNLEARSNALYDKVDQELKIKKGSKESALVQDYGEKTLAKNYLEKKGIDPSTVSKEELNRINETELQRLAGDKAANIKEADKFFRKDYKKMIGEINTTRKEIYPNNPDKLVPEREDYYHHFNELTGMEAAKDFLQQNRNIDTHLAGISTDTKPKSKWQGFMQKRGDGAYTSDAVGGYLKYLEAASHSTHIDPIANVIRNEAEHLATSVEGTKELNHLKEALEYHANDLTGKTNPFFDRTIQSIIGRKGMHLVNTVNGHIKKNLILGNVGSIVGQIGNIPLTLGKAKQYAGQGAIDTIKDMAAELIPGVTKDASSPINQSVWLKERFKGKLFSRFDQGLLKKPEKMAAWMLEQGDKTGTYLAWNSMYRKGLAKGVADPIKYADEQARHIIGGRGIGEVPIYQKSKVTGLVAPFSLEVGNAWKVLGKQMNEKDFGGIITFLATSAVLNAGMRQVRGSDVSFNPIGAALDGINKDKTASATDKAKLAGANVIGEIAGNIPGGSYIPQALGKLNSTTKKAIFGNNSPDRYGTGVGVTSTIFKPIIDVMGNNKANFLEDALKVALPFGGNQVKKTVDGIKTLSKGGAYDSKGRLEYPVDSNNAADLLHSLLLGPSTTGQGQKYFQTNGRALSDKDTATFQNMQQIGQGQTYFDSVTKKRAISAIDKQIKTVMKAPDLSPLDKQRELMRLQQVRLQAMQK